MVNYEGSAKAEEESQLSRRAEEPSQEEEAQTEEDAAQRIRSEDEQAGTGSRHLPTEETRGGEYRRTDPGRGESGYPAHGDRPDRSGQARAFDVLSVD